MRRLLLSAVATFGLFVAAPADTEAQIWGGPFVAYHDDADFGVGGQVKMGMPGVHSNFGVGADIAVFFPGDNVSYFEVNANGLFQIPIQNAGLRPYVLGGLNIARVSVDADIPGVGDFSASDTDLGLNLGGGLDFGSGSLRPFAQAKITLGGGEGFVLAGGFNFLLGG